MLWALFLLIAAQFDSTFRDGLLALNRNDLIAAKAQLEAASTFEPKDARVWLALAQTYGKLGDETRARDAARRSAELASGNAVVLRGLETFYFELAQADLRRERFADALATLDAGRRTFARSAQLALAAGVAYYGLRRFPDAIDAFLRTVELDPSVEQSYVFLARMTEQAEERLPKIEAAFAAFQKRAPDSYLSNFVLGKVQGAEALLRKSIAARGDFADSHFELGVVLERERKYDDAAREFARAAELKPGDAAPHYHLARLYDRLGKHGDAARERAIHARLTTAAPGMGAGVK